MDEGLSRIAALAWRTAPAAKANEAIASARRATAAGEEVARLGRLGVHDMDNEVTDPSLEPDAEGPMARSYEIVLPADATFAAFAAEQLPRLVYHLESIGAHLPHTRGVVICLFIGETLYFLQTEELIEECCDILGVSVEELVRRHGTGELRTAVSGPRLALPPPENAD